MACGFVLILHFASLFSFVFVGGVDRGNGGKSCGELQIDFDYFGYRYVFAFWFDCQALANGRGELEFFLCFPKSHKKK